jgi:hypothetical protein
MRMWTEMPGGSGLDRDLALDEILARVRHELVDLRDCADELQAVIGSMVIRSSVTLELSARIKLQAADALSQRLAGLAQLVRALEAEIPAGVNLSHGREPSLNLARALVRLGGGAARHVTPAEQGDCEFF